MSALLVMLPGPAPGRRCVDAIGSLEILEPSFPISDQGLEMVPPIFEPGGDARFARQEVPGSCLDWTTVMEHRSAGEPGHDVVPAPPPLLELKCAEHGAPGDGGCQCPCADAVKRDLRRPQGLANQAVVGAHPAVSDSHAFETGSMASPLHHVPYDHAHLDIGGGR